MKKLVCFFALLFCSSIAFSGTQLVVGGPSLDVNFSRVNGNQWGLANSYGVNSIYHPACTSYYYALGHCHPTTNLTDFTRSDIKSALQQANVGQAICIGGGFCGESNTLIVSYLANTWVSTLKVYAHDRIGSSTKAHLQLWVNGSFISEKDVLKDGGWIDFSVNNYTNQIELRSVQEAHNAGGDELAISRLVSY